MTEPVKFYMDEHVNPAVSRGLRLRGIDVLTLQDVGMLGASDGEHMRMAHELGRVIFTNDNDF